MPTMDETLDLLTKETQTPEFRALGQGQQGLAVRQILGSSKEFSGLGPADQAAVLASVLEAAQAGPPQKGAGEFAQEVGMETLLPAAAGTAGTALGGVRGGALATMGAGQLAEFTRPGLAGEPMRTVPEQIVRRSVEGAFSVGTDVGVMALGKAASATGRFVANRVRKSLGVRAAADLPEEILGAQRVQQRAGQELLPFQLRGEEPGGVLATFEDVALNSFGGNQVRIRMANQQVDAATAYKDELMNQYVQSLDSDTLTSFITGAIKDRKIAAKEMRAALYGQLREATPQVRIDITDLVDDIRPMANVEAFQKALGGAVPEAFTAAPKPKAVKRLPGLPGLDDPTLGKASATIADDIGNIANRISQLRGIARKTRDEGVRNTANRMANELNRRALEKMPAEAAPLWEAARGFAGAEADVLRNDMFVSLMKQAQQKPDALIRSLMRPTSGDAAVALKRALDAPITGPGGQSIPGTNRWKEIVQPAIHNAFLDLTVDKSGTMVGGKLLTQLRSLSKKQVDEVLGQGMFSAMRDLGNALEIASTKPSGTGLLTVRSVQTGAVMTLIGAAATGAAPATAAVVGAGTVLIGPRMFSRIMANPALVRSFTKAIRTPGKNFVNVSRFVGRVGALQSEEDVSRMALEESLSVLRDVRQSRFGSVIPLQTRP